MNRNQKVAFWSMFIGFCFTATVALYSQGAFNKFGIGGAIMLVAFYLGVALLIWWYVRSSPGAVEKWFQ